MCQVCDQQAVESETHFLLHCNVYDDLRRLLFDKSERRDNNFTFMSDTDKLRFILTHQERECAKYIVNAMSRRKLKYRLVMQCAFSFIYRGPLMIGHVSGRRGEISRLGLILKRCSGHPGVAMV